MIIPNIKNLIKDDFSDFTAYQGAVVTKNKTFPIDVFKGGRNLLTIASVRPYTANWYKEPSGELKSIIAQSNINAIQQTNVWGMENGKTYSVQLDIKCESGEINMGNRLFYVNSKTNAQHNIAKITTEYQRMSVSFVYDSSGTTQILHLYFASHGSQITIKNQKVTLGNNLNEPYSPAPEDGYDYTGDDGAYHIETIKGTAQAQMFVGSGAVLDTNQTVSVGIKNFGSNLFVRTNNPLIHKYVALNDYERVSMTSNNTRMEMGGSVDLDFIASNPIIYDETSVRSMNILDIVQLPEISKEDKQLTILSTDEVIIDDFISLNMSTKGSLYQRNMKYCEVVLSGKYELTSKWINIKRFVASDLVDNGNLQEIDYGDFGVLKSEYDDTTQRTKLICYDRMLQAQIPYDSEVMNLTYPMTISQVLNRLAIVCKLDLVVNTVNNLYQVIHSDLWANQSFTYADVLDHIAQATTSIISIRNNKLEIFNPIDNDFTIQGKFYSLKIGESYGRTNIVNVSQEPQHYNKFAPSNALDIPLEERKELAFSNNPILNQDMQTWADRLYLQVKDLEYSTFESSTIGYGIFEVGDMVDVYEAGEDVIHRVMITNETFDFKHALTTEIGSSMPMVHKNQYVVETDQARQGQTTYLIVDQLNGVIEALVQKVDDEADKTAQLRIDVDSIESTVENLPNGNLMTNGSGELGFLGWSGGSRARYVTPKIRYMDGLTYSMGFIPQQNLQSLAEWEISIYEQGYSVAPIIFIVPDVEHSYRAKITSSGAQTIDVLEFNSIENANDLIPDKTTSFTSAGSGTRYFEFTFTPSTSTQFVRIRYNHYVGVSVQQRISITEVMFNRGQPREWQPSPNNSNAYSNSVRTQLSNKIEDVVTEVDRVNGEIHNAGVEINARDGIEVYGKKFVIKNEQRTKEVFSVVTIEGEEAVKMVGDFETTDGTIKLSSRDRSISVGDVRLANRTQYYDDLQVHASQTEFVSTQSDNLGNALTFTGENIFFTFAQVGANRGYPWEHDLANYTVELTSDMVTTNRIRGTLTGQEIEFTHSLIPVYNNTTTIGSNEKRVNNIYLINQPNVSSDTRYKSDIQDIDPKLIEIIGREIKPKQYRTQFDDKIHFGYIAQDVERALYKYCGNDKDKYAMLHKDESYMSLLYGELNVIIEAYNRKRNDELEERIERLEELLNDTKKS